MRGSAAALKCSVWCASRQSSDQRWRAHAQLGCLFRSRDAPGTAVHASVCAVRGSAAALRCSVWCASRHYCAQQARAHALLGCRLRSRDAPGTAVRRIRLALRGAWLCSRAQMQRVVRFTAISSASARAAGLSMQIPGRTRDGREAATPRSARCMALQPRSDAACGALHGNLATRDGERTRSWAVCVDPGTHPGWP